MKTPRGISRRSGAILVTLALVTVVVAVLLACGEGNDEADTRLFLVRFHESVDRTLVEEHGGEVWTIFRSTVYAYMTPEAAQALAEHEAVEWVEHRQLFLITFSESVDHALVEVYGGEIWIMYPNAGKINAWMTPDATEALAGREAVEYIDQRQLFAIRFEESIDLALVEEYEGEVFDQSSIRPVVYGFMTPEAAGMLAEHPAVRYAEPDWPLEMPSESGS